MRIESPPNLHRIASRLVPCLAFLLVIGCDAEYSTSGLTAADAPTDQAVATKGKPPLAVIRSATGRYHNLEAAMADGYGLIPGVDACMSDPELGAMGVHYIDGDAMDDVLDPAHPEALVYIPGEDGELELVAVEYLVPFDAWPTAPSEEGAPEVFGWHLHPEPDLGLYALHVWPFLHNPSGTFADFNPSLSCPAE